MLLSRSHLPRSPAGLILAIYCVSLLYSPLFLPHFIGKVFLVVMSTVVQASLLTDSPGANLHMYHWLFQLSSFSLALNFSSGYCIDVSLPVFLTIMRDPPGMLIFLLVLGGLTLTATIDTFQLFHSQFLLVLWLLWQFYSPYHATTKQNITFQFFSPTRL